MLKIIFALAIFIPNFSFACSCAGYSSILKGVLGRNTDAAVVVVENTQSLSHGVRAKVSEVLYGNVDKNEISIWGDPGHLCRGAFVAGVGRKWVAVIGKIANPYTDESVGDFETESCMATSLKIESDDVVGMIMGQSGSMRMKLDDLKSILKSPKDFLVPQVTCQVTTAFRNQDDHVDYFKKVEQEVNLSTGAMVSMDFVAKSEENKDYKGHVEGVVIREQPDQLFSPTKIKVTVTIQDLIKPLSIEHNADFPMSLYSRFVASSYADNQLSCTADVKLK